MNKLFHSLKSLSILSSLLISNLAVSRTLITAEETAYKYIRAIEVSNGQYQFTECYGELEGMKCSEIEGLKRTYSTREIKKLANMNTRHAYYATGSGVALVAASLYFGLILGAKASAAYYVGAGASLDGGVAAAGGAVFGLPAGAATGGAITSAVDELDPFVHRDMSIAYEVVIDIADESNLEDVEAIVGDDYVIVEIEDINFNQLKNKIISQLKDLD